MAHVGKERRFQSVSLQGTVTGRDKFLFGVFITLDTLAYTQYPIRYIYREPLISGTPELPPLISAICVLQPETHARVRLMPQHDIVEMPACAGKVFRMDNPIQFFPRNIVRIVVAIETLQQSVGKMEAFQSCVVLPRINGTFLNSHIEKTLLHLFFGYITADNCHTRQFVFRKDRNHLARNREISTFGILLHECLFRYNDRLPILYHLFQQSLQDVLAIHVNMENGTGNLSFVRTCRIHFCRQSQHLH